MSLTLMVPDRTELHSLYEWLRRDAGLARDATVTMASSGRHPGEQGALDVVDVLLRDVSAIGGLSVSIAMWRLSRRRNTTVTIRRAGEEVTVDGADAETVAKAIRALPPDPAPGKREGQDNDQPDRGQ